MSRRAVEGRKTKETEITVALELEGGDVLRKHRCGLF